MGINSGNPAFDAAALASEQLKQQDNYFNNLTDYGRPAAGNALTPLQIDHNRASAAHFRRLITAANANGVSPAPYIAALQALGQPLYP
jgi:hypothetical protein